MPRTMAAHLVHCHARRMPCVMAPGARRASLVRTDMRGMCDGAEACGTCPCAPGMRAACHTQWGCVSIGAHAAHDGAGCPARIPGMHRHAPHALALSRTLCTMGARVRRRACRARWRRVPGVHPWCAGTCAACLSAVAHAAHDGGVCLSVCMLCATALHPGTHPWVPRDVRCMPVVHPWGAWTYGACRHMFLCTRVACPGCVGCPGPPGRAARRLDLCGTCRQERVGARGGGRGVWGGCWGLLKMAGACGWRAGHVGECWCAWRKMTVCLGGVTCLKGNTWWFSNLCTIISYQKSHVRSNLNKNPLSNSQ